MTKCEYCNSRAKYNIICTSFNNDRNVESVVPKNIKKIKSIPEIAKNNLIIKKNLCFICYHDKPNKYANIN